MVEFMTVRDVFQSATAARDAGRLEEAERLLQSISERDRTFPAFHAVYGHVLWGLERLDEAIDAFRQAVILAPNSEAVSLGLFHCLWEVERTDEAFDEMRRFLKNNKSEEYSRLLTDINRS